MLTLVSLIKSYFFKKEIVNLLVSNFKVHSTNPYLRKFHEVVYDTDSTREHKISKRSADESVKFKFSSHGR
jgi:hypothetical protein